MVDFRRWFPALALIALMLGLSLTASAQQGFTCTPSGVPANVRGEGIAELLGDVVLICRGGIPTAAGNPVLTSNFTISLNTQITSRITATGWSEALLVIDEPQPGDQVACVQTTASSICGFNGTGTPSDPITNRPGGVSYVTGDVQNVYQARFINQAGQQYLAWNGVPIDPPGTNGVRTLRFTNLRGNASGVGIPTTFLPNQISALISVAGTQQLALTSNIQQVGTVFRGLLPFTVEEGQGPAGPFLQCVGATPGRIGPAFRGRFVEGFASSFKNRNANPGLSTFSPGNAIGDPPVPRDGSTYSASTVYAPVAQNEPNTPYNTETGFYNPNFPTTNGLNTAGLATNGTRLIVRVTNVPTGATLYAGIYENIIVDVANDPATPNVDESADNGAGPRSAGLSRVVLMTGLDANGAGVGTPATGSTVNGVNNVYAVPTTGGAATLVYEVVTADPNVPETIDIPFYLSFPANSSTNLTSQTALPTLSGALAPISTVTRPDVTPAPPVPRFVDLPTSDTAFVINPCRTNLLFPFVSNQFGFDTGIAISNTSRDIFETTEQTGPCSIYYFGCTLVGGACTGAAPNSQRTQASVPAGQTMTFTLSFGSNATYGVAGAQGFSGYLIAQCDFQYAHGFAFLTNGGQTVAHGYLALVMDAPTGPRSGYESEGLLQ